MLRAFIQSLPVLEFHDQEEPTSPSISTKCTSAPVRIGCRALA